MSYVNKIMALADSASLRHIEHVACLRCKSCGKKYSLGIQSSCNDCFGPLEVVYNDDVVSEYFRKETIEEGPPNIWRYWPLLPSDRESGLNGLNPGMTPLRDCRNLARFIGIKRIFVKDDTVNPTYSFKDRPVAVSVPKAIELGLKRVGCASTGNLAGATAAAAAKYALSCYVFVPRGLPQTKLLATSIYGAGIIEVKGSYDNANRIANLVADRLSIGLVNINLRPYYVEGSKTLAFEVVEQLKWEEPDRIIVPMGSGALLTAVHRGLNELRKYGLSTGSASVCGTQPARCAPISSAFNNGEDILPVERPETVAESLAIGDPASGGEAIEAIRKTGGFADAPSDEEIIEGQLLLAREEGIFSEPAGGTVIASLKRKVEDGSIASDETVVCLITGNGLKATSHLKFSQYPVVAAPQEAISAIETMEGRRW